MRISISSHSKLALIVVLAVTLLFGAGSFAPAHAATLTVNTSADDNTNNGNCSLREAIRAAVNHTAVDACSAGTGNDLITFSVSSVTVNSTLPTITAGNTITLYGGAAKVSLIINISGGNLFVTNAGSTLNMQNVNTSGSAFACFQSAGTINLTNETFSGCSLVVFASAGTINLQSVTSGMIDTSLGNAVVHISDSSMYGGVPSTLNLGTGGGTVSNTKFGLGQVHITTSGPLTIDHSILSHPTGNAAGISAGGVGATVVVKNTIITNTTQTAIDPEAGAQFTIINSTIAGNTFGINGSSGMVNLKNTVLSNTYNCYPSGGFTLVDLGGNFQSTSSGNCPLLPSGNPKLGRGYIPLAGSPLIDGGLNAGCLTDDYYGNPRPVDGDGNGSVICDIGAFEKQ